MLSERQCELIKHKVNAESDIPFISESTESRIIDKVIETLNPHFEPAFRALCPDPYIDCLKIALAEGVDIADKRARISEILRLQLSEPLAEKLAGILDIALVPEDVEEKILRVVTKKVVEEMVEWTVGEIDEQLGARLVESREAVGL